MPPPRTRPRWPSTIERAQRREYTQGYIEPSRARIGMPQCELRYRGHRRILHLPFAPEHEAKALKELDKWITAIKKGEKSKHRGPITAAQARDEYYDLKVKTRKCSEKQKKKVRCALETLLCRDGEKDWYMNDEAFEERLQKWLKKPIGYGGELLGANTIRDGYVKPLRSWIKYALTKRWITIDPYPVLTLPDEKVIAAGDRVLYNEEERRKIFKWFDEQIAKKGTIPLRPGLPTLQDHRDLHLMMSYCGARPSELIALRWSGGKGDPVVTEDEIVIQSKKTGERRLPLKFWVWPDLTAMLERRRREHSTIDDRVFPFKATNHIADLMKEVLADQEIPDNAVNGRRTYVWRATAEHRLRYEFDIPEKVALQIVGHEERIYKKNYSTVPSGAELARQAPAPKKRRGK